MAFELVTGRYGTPHISSEDVRAYQGYTAGAGRYILSGGGASVDGTTLELSPVELLIDGAHMRIVGDGETITLTAGTSGYNRVDLVTIHYHKDGSDIEGVEFVVLEGTPVTGSASEPSLPADGNLLDGVIETYVPYCSIAYSGTSIQQPIVLLDDYALPIDRGGTGNSAGLAASATRLATARTIRTNLASTSAASFDGSASITPGVTGVLPISNGGTGVGTEEELGALFGGLSVTTLYAASSMTSAGSRAGLGGISLNDYNLVIANVANRNRYAGTSFSSADYASATVVFNTAGSGTSYSPHGFSMFIGGETAYITVGQARLYGVDGIYYIEASGLEFPVASYAIGSATDENDVVVTHVWGVG